MNDYQLQHKNLLRLLDILVALSFVMNFGAVCLTNAMVAHEHPATVYTEANPAQIKLNGYVENPKAQSFYWVLIKQLILLAAMFGCYWSLRLRVRSKPQLVLLCVVVSLMFYFLGHDFFNDFGFYIGARI